MLPAPVGDSQIDRCVLLQDTSFKGSVDRRNEARNLLLIASREEGVGNTLDATRTR